jgi:uncharacterized membrane protein
MRTGRHERGQITLLVIGFAAILLLLVAVVVDASQAVLVRRTLASLADGAALAAAQSLAEAPFYTGTAVGVLPIDERQARQAVAGYLGRAAADAGMAEVRLVAVAVDGNRVEVVLATRARLPLSNTVTAAFEGTVVTARAGATSPIG